MSPDLYAIRRDHGGIVYDGGRRWIGPGPGHSRRDASLSVWLTDEGRALVHSFAGDPFTACLAHLGLEQQQSAQVDRAEWGRLRREREVREREDRRRKQEFCAKLWSEAGAAGGSIVERYLIDARSIPLATVPAVLRFHPTCPNAYAWSDAAKEGRVRPGPAMVALITDVRGIGTGVHVTFLKPDGSGKARGDGSRLKFGSVQGGAVRLAPGPQDGALAAAEGIETALSFAALSGAPTWAALSTSCLQGLELPDTVSRLIIGADGDQAGMTASTRLAKRLQSRCDVTVMAAPAGTDWNDKVAERANA